MGFCCEELGRPKDAAAHYRKALDNDWSYAPALARLAAVELLAGNVDHAIEAVGTLLEAFPEQAELRPIVAQLNHLAGQHELAIEQFETAIAMEPENWSLLDDEVEQLVIAGEFRNAIARLKELMSAEGPSADMHARLGDLYSRCGDDDEALKHLHSALADEPNYLEAHVKLGTHHLVCGRWEQAAEAFYAAAELNDSSIAKYVGLSAAYAALGQMEDAENSLDLASAIEPNSTLLLAETARLQLKAITAKELIHDYDSGVLLSDITAELDNDTLMRRQVDCHAQQVRRHDRRADLKYRYGILLCNEARPIEAMTQLAGAISLCPAYAQAIIRLGLLQHQNGNSDEAIKTFAGMMTPDYPTIKVHYQLALLHTDRKRMAETINAMQLGQDASKIEQLSSAMAISLQQLGLVDAAAAMWRSLRLIHQGEA